jgi:transcriptional regulator with XRE-family HTH domain
MIIGEKLRILRERKDMSQGDIEKCTGLLRCYISRVENGHTVPSVDTLEKMARAITVSYRASERGEPIRTAVRSAIEYWVLGSNGTETTLKG